jgi:small subunit ribosomal protein S13
VARIAGVDLPREKRVEYALPYIFGIGLTLSRVVLKEAAVNFDTRVKDLTEDEISRIATIISTQYRVEGDLRREIGQNLKRLMDIGSYRGMRHRKSLPVRGQRTKTNARTRKGKRRTVGLGHKAATKT